MESYSSSPLPLRFSSIFRTNREIDFPEPHRSDRHQFFETDVIVNTRTPQCVSLLIAGKRDETTIKSKHAYRIDGQVVAGVANAAPVIIEDPDSTISFDHAEVSQNSLVNKTSTYGFGIIVEWSHCPFPGRNLNVEFIKVLHRNSTGNRADFFAHYYVESYLTSTLSTNALNVGNIISLRGHVVGHQMSTNTWQIQTTEIHQVIHSKPQRPLIQPPQASLDATTQ